MSEKPTTAIVKVESYKILKVAPDRRRELMAQNVGNGGVSEFDLPSVKFPSGGALMFEVPTIEGSDFVQSIEGIVVGWRDVRVYWEHAYGEGEAGPPDCASDNSHGTGNPGGSCYGESRPINDAERAELARMTPAKRDVALARRETGCPFAKFGSDPKEGSKGQACQQRRILMVMRPGSLLPLIISLPPTSVKDARKFFFRLLDGEKAPHEVVVSIGLEKDKNAGGVEYARATFKVVETLPPELAKQFAEIRDSFGPQLKAAVVNETEATTDE